MHDDELLMRTLTNERATFEDHVRLSSRSAQNKAFRPIFFALQIFDRSVSSRWNVMMRESFDGSLGLFQRLRFLRVPRSPP
jgi:hypothetical protein